MSVITIKGIDIPYDESEVITFVEGLIGMPDMRRAVLVPMDKFEPFSWLASVESEKARFIVVDPKQVFAEYTLFKGDHAGARLLTLAIVKISSDWQKTTVNLRAPLVINKETHVGTQMILSESKYQFAEPLAQN